MVIFNEGISPRRATPPTINTGQKENSEVLNVDFNKLMEDEGIKNDAELFSEESDTQKTEVLEDTFTVLEDFRIPQTDMIIKAGETLRIIK